MGWAVGEWNWYLLYSFGMLGVGCRIATAISCILDLCVCCACSDSILQHRAVGGLGLGGDGMCDVCGCVVVGGEKEKRKERKG